jgi:hypothetical protein
MCCPRRQVQERSQRTDGAASRRLTLSQSIFPLASSGAGNENEKPKEGARGKQSEVEVSRERETQHGSSAPRRGLSSKGGCFLSGLSRPVALLRWWRERGRAVASWKGRQKNQQETAEGGRWGGGCCWLLGQGGDDDADGVSVGEEGPGDAPLAVGAGRCLA